MDNRAKWIALIVLCLGELMIVLDTTIVNVALPSIRTSLGFSESTLVWVVNAYLLTFGGFLLLGGRLGDLYGHKKLFIIGILSFTIASIACGVANSQLILIGARAIQGIAGAIVSAVALSLIMNTFTENKERAKAMGVYGFVAAGGGSIGVLLGGLLSSLDWHWVFLVNVPIGIMVMALSYNFLSSKKDTNEKPALDIFGAITITLALMLAVYGIVNGNESGWLSIQTLGLIVISIILHIIFLIIETKVKHPLVPLRIFKNMNVTISNIVGILWAASMFAWFFISALYMQLVLGYTPLIVGLAFLPSNIIMAIFSLGLSAKIVTKFGIRRPLSIGLFVASLGLFLFSRAPVNGSLFDVIPGMILLGLGGGIAFNPMLLAAMSGVKHTESGLASGVVNTSFMMGGALGLAILASIAAAITSSMLKTGSLMPNALNSGYQIAFIVGGIFAFIASLMSLMLKDIENVKEQKH